MSQRGKDRVGQRDFVYPSHAVRSIFPEHRLSRNAPMMQPRAHISPLAPPKDSFRNTCKPQEMFAESTPAFTESPSCHAFLLATQQKQTRPIRIAYWHLLSINLTSLLFASSVKWPALAMCEASFKGLKYLKRNNSFNWQPSVPRVQYTVWTFCQNRRNSGLTLDKEDKAIDSSHISQCHARNTAYTLIQSIELQCKLSTTLCNHCHGLHSSITGRFGSMQQMCWANSSVFAQGTNPQIRLDPLDE